jgi:hypothetical protein
MKSQFKSEIYVVRDRKALAAAQSFSEILAACSPACPECCEPLRDGVCANEDCVNLRQIEADRRSA